MNNTTLRRVVMIVAMVSALPWAATAPSACSGGGVGAEPALVTAFQDLQIDAITILPEAVVTKRLDKFEAGESLEEFEVFLFDDATDSEFYCSGRTEGMVAVRAVNVAYTNLGATFIPMQHQKVVVGANPAATLDRVRVEVWEMDHGVCPGQTETTETDNFLVDANDLVAVQVFPAKALLAAQELNIDNKVTMTISLKGGAIVADPSLAVPELKAIQLESLSFGPFVDVASNQTLFGGTTPQLEVAFFNAATSAVAACVGKSGLQHVTTAGTDYAGLKLPLQFAEGVSTLPSTVRVGLVDVDSTGCPGGIQPGLGDDLIAISTRIPITQLVGTKIIMNDNVSTVTFGTAAATP